jgi:hypothetical protein
VADQEVFKAEVLAALMRHYPLDEAEKPRKHKI